MFQICVLFAEFERAMIQGRENAGLARGTQVARNVGVPKFVAEHEDHYESYSCYQEMWVLS